jgi:hypothetical protein
MNEKKYHRVANATSGLYINSIAAEYNKIICYSIFHNNYE